jgi:hypothetical protein
LKAGTKKADQIHDYYIKLEELLQETLQEQTDELQLQLEQKDKLIKKLENKIVKKQNRVQYKERNVVYMIQDEFHKKERIYVIGKAVDLTDRLSQYDKSRPFDVIYYRECNTAQQMALIEKNVLTKLNKYREVINKDRFILPLDKDVSFFTNVIDFFVDAFKDVEDIVGINNLTEEEQSEYIQQKEKEKCEERREDNIDYIKERDKKYQDEHKDQIMEYQKKYREEHKSEISENKKEYYQKNKEKIIDKRKEYRDAHKEEIKIRKTEKIICECGILICKDYSSRHKKSKIHNNLLKTKTQVSL